MRGIEWLKELFSFGFPFLRSVEYQRVLAKTQRVVDEGNDDVAIFVELADDMPAFRPLSDAGPHAMDLCLNKANIFPGNANDATFKLFQKLPTSSLLLHDGQYPPALQAVSQLESTKFEKISIFVPSVG